MCDSDLGMRLVRGSPLVGCELRVRSAGDSTSRRVGSVRLVSAPVRAVDRVMAGEAFAAPVRAASLGSVPRMVRVRAGDNQNGQMQGLVPSGISKGWNYGQFS